MSVPAAYLAVIAIWSTTPLAIQWSTLGSSFSFAVMSRMLLGLAVCGALLMARRVLRQDRPKGECLAAYSLRVRMPFHRAARAVYTVGGLTLAASMLCTYWGAQHIPSGLISVIFGLSPLATSVFATLWLREHALTRLRLAGLALGIAGLWVIFGQPWPGEGDAAAGTAAVLGGMTLQALGLVWIKRIVTQHGQAQFSSLAITTGTLAVATPLFVLSWLVFDRGTLPPQLTPRAVVAIAYLGVLGSVVGFTLYYYVIKHLDAGRVALITLVTPVTALLLGQTLNHERIPASGWLGIALTGAGLMLYEWQTLRQVKERPDERAA